MSNKIWYAQTTSADQSLIGDEATGRTVAVAYDYHDGDLLAAAPELLEACKIGLHYMDCLDMETADEKVREDLLVVRAAIHKAQGECQ